MHPAKEGFSALPFFDEFDLSTVDILLISQYVNLPAPLGFSGTVYKTAWLVFASENRLGSGRESHFVMGCSSASMCTRNAGQSILDQCLLFCGVYFRICAYVRSAESLLVTVVEDAID